MRAYAVEHDHRVILPLVLPAQFVPPLCCPAWAPWRPCSGTPSGSAGSRLAM
jgi:hypothetical protein